MTQLIFILVIFFIFCPCVLVVSMLLSKRMSRWGRLEREYRFDGAFTGTLNRCRSLTVRTVRFRNTSSIGTD